MPACHAGGRGFEPRHSRHSFQRFRMVAARAFRSLRQSLGLPRSGCRGWPCGCGPDRTKRTASVDRSSSKGSHPPCPLSPIDLPARRRIRHSAAIQGRPGRTQPARRCWEPCSPGNMAAAAAMFPGEQGSQHRLAGCVRPGRPCMAAECRMRLLAGKSIGDNGHGGWDPFEELRSTLAVLFVRSGPQPQGQPRQPDRGKPRDCRKDLNARAATMRNL